MVDIDLSEPHREMREETRAFFAMSAGRDEVALIHDHEKMGLEARTSGWAWQSKRLLKYVTGKRA